MFAPGAKLVVREGNKTYTERVSKKRKKIGCAKKRKKKRKKEGEQKEREAKNREGEHISLEYAPRQARMLSYILRLKCSFLFG